MTKLIAGMTRLTEPLEIFVTKIAELYLVRTVGSFKIKLET